MTPKPGDEVTVVISGKVRLVYHNGTVDVHVPDMRTINFFADNLHHPEQVRLLKFKRGDRVNGHLLDTHTVKSVQPPVYLLTRDTVDVLRGEEELRPAPPEPDLAEALELLEKAAALTDTCSKTDDALKVVLAAARKQLENE